MSSAKILLVYILKTEMWSRFKYFLTIKEVGH